MCLWKGASSISCQACQHQPDFPAHRRLLILRHSLFLSPQKLSELEHFTRMSTVQNDQHA